MNYKLIENNKKARVNTKYKVRLVSDKDFEIEKIILSCSCMSYFFNEVTKTITVTINVGIFPRHLIGNSYNSFKSVTIKFKDGTSEKHKIMYKVVK